MVGKSNRPSINLNKRLRATGEILFYWEGRGRGETGKKPCGRKKIKNTSNPKHQESWNAGPGDLQGALCRWGGHRSTNKKDTKRQNREITQKEVVFCLE